MALVAAMKIGSTTLSALAGDSLSRPRWREHTVARLLGASDEEARAVLTRQLEHYRQTLASLGVRRLVIGAGELLRQRPRLLENLNPWAPAIWAMTPSEEAQLTWAAVQAAETEPVTVLDIGGGSTEVVSSRGWWSHPIGMEADQPAPEAVAWPEPPSTRLVVVGGLVQGLEALLTLQPTRPLRESLALAEKLSVPGWVERGVDADRAPLLRRGFRILGAALAAWGWPEVAFSRRGLLEGLWLAASLGRGWRL
ncbi:MAG: hypothetical protein K6U87_09560 [Firmicutes bacterium]|nr:hypothetical protein [Bacillota bacterium]